MSFPKFLIIAALALFTLIAAGALLKGRGSKQAGRDLPPIEVALDHEVHVVPAPERSVASVPEFPLPEADRINGFFNKGENKFPIVQTVTYKSRVPWQKGRPAWVSDYALHYKTSRHFIARSLHGKPDYFKQDVSEGARFNVLNPEKNLQFYLLIDTSRCKMWFYYLDLDQNERMLVKTYAIGLGRLDNSKPSGLLTPLGKYALGDKTAIYKPKVMGYHNGQKQELVRVYGTRWIPFGDEISSCTAPAAGLGLQGAPWIPNEEGELTEDLSCIGKYESDGCIRFASQDIEELFAIVISRPTTIELVKDFYDAKLPGTEAPAIQMNQE
jgi:hypothetical protein